METTTRLTRKQAADRAGVGVRTVDNWRRAGKLTTYRTRGHQVRIDQAELDNYLEIAPEKRNAH